MIQILTAAVLGLLFAVIAIRVHDTVTRSREQDKKPQADTDDIS